MTPNKIQEATDGLRRVNGLLGKYVCDQVLSYEEKRELWLFHKEHKDTNALIDYAEAAAHDNIDLLYEDARRLLSEAENTIAIFTSHEAILSSFESKTAAEHFIEPSKRAYESAREKATEAGGRYDEWRNKLEAIFFGGRHDEEEDAKKKCDESERHYKDLKERNEHFYRIYFEEQRKWAGLYCFDIILLNVLANKLSAISRSIIRDITTIRQEGGL